MAKTLKINEEEYIKVGILIPISALKELFTKFGVKNDNTLTELSISEAHIYNIIKEKPTSAQELQEWAGCSGGRISQIMNGKEGNLGLLAKRKDIIKKTVPVDKEHRKVVYSVDEE